MLRHISLIIAVLALASGALNAQFSAYVELSGAITGYNDAQSPNNATTDRFSFIDDLESPAIVPSGRLHIRWNVAPKHQVGLLMTPLTVNADGQFDRSITYEGETFLPGEDIEAVYTFNSYRLQYRYMFPKLKVLRSLGLSIKVRDAVISLKSDTKYAEKTDLGVVPLISFDLGHRFNDKWEINFEGEALASKFGRAEDVQLSVDYRVNESNEIRLGYRLLEGGSDIDEVYTFALFHYPTIGWSMEF